MDGHSGKRRSKEIVDINDLFQRKFALTRTLKESQFGQISVCSREKGNQGLVTPSQCESWGYIQLVYQQYIYLNNFLIRFSPFPAHHMLFYSPNVIYSFSKAKRTSLPYFKAQLITI